jgi:hypothetical protein
MPGCGERPVSEYCLRRRGRTWLGGLTMRVGSISARRGTVLHLGHADHLLPSNDAEALSLPSTLPARAGHSRTLAVRAGAAVIRRHLHLRLRHRAA